MPKVVLGVTGSISAYKAAELVRLMVKRDWEVRVVMTEGATKFVTPLTFQTLSRNKVVTDMFEPVADSLSRAASPILTRVGEGMCGGASAMEAWEALKKDRRFIAGTGHALLKEDREALSALFARLGESGRESQDALLTGAAERLASLTQSAGERADAAEKLYVTLGFLTGLLLAIIVI